MRNKIVEIVLWITIAVCFSSGGALLTFSAVGMVMVW